MQPTAIALVMITCLAPQMGFSAEPELIAHWKLDETKGGTVADSSPHRIEGKIAGEPGRVAGKIDGALAFNGKSWVELPNSKTLDSIHSESYSIAAWFKPEIVPPGTEDAANDAQFGIVMKTGWHAGLSYSHNKQFTMTHWLKGDTDPTWNGTGTWEDEYEPGQWYHLVGIVDQQERTVQIYVNGVLNKTSEPWAAGTKSFDYGDQTWKIGVAAPGSEQYAWYTKGAIDDVRIWKGALTAEQVKALYTAGTKAPQK